MISGVFVLQQLDAVFGVSRTQPSFVSSSLPPAASSSPTRQLSSTAPYELLCICVLSLLCHVPSFFLAPFAISDDILRLAACDGPPSV